MDDYNAINSFPRPNLPDGFRTLLFSLSKEVLREQPTDLYEFAADFFGRRLLNRGDSWVTFKERYNMRKKERMKEEAAKQKTMPETVTESTTDLQFPTEFTPEQEEAAVKIQAGVRGMLARRSITRPEGSAEAERERWLHPQQQLECDLQTVSASISFAQLESQDGVWEECQRWLHPEEQLQRDFETVAEPVQCAHQRDRGPSLEDARATAAAAAALELMRHQRPLSPDDPASPQISDTAIDIPEAGRAGSPPEVASPAHSDISVAGGAGPATAAAPERAPSISSVRSARGSDVSLAEHRQPSASTPGARANSLEAISAEKVGPASSPTSPVPPPTSILDKSTAGSRVDLAGEDTGLAPGDATDRAGSPPEANTPRHSDVDLASERQSPGLGAERAGSPPEANTPRHSDVDLAGEHLSPGPDAQRAGSPSEALTPQHSDVEVAGAAPPEGETGPRADSPDAGEQ